MQSGWKVQRKKVQKSKNENQREVLILEEQIQELKHKDPESLTRFNHFPISKNTLRGLKVSKYLHPTLVQQLTLVHAMQGKDVVTDAKTGSGKTLAFVIPMVEAMYRACWCRKFGLAAIIVAPTRELAYQVHEVVKRVIQFHRFSSGLIIGGKDLASEYHLIGSFNILVCTPGRLHQHMEQTPNFNLSTLKMFIVDEADLCLSMGFAEMMNTILTNLPMERQTLLFSATQTRDVNTLIKSGCTKPVFCSTHQHTKVATPSNLKQSYATCEAHDKLNFIYSFLNYYKKKKVLVFLSTCKQVKFFSAILSNLKLRRKVVDMHGCMKQHMRMNIYNVFQKEKTAVMVATDIASRGLDFRGVDWVVQLDCPENVTTYIHRVGRTARFFKEGEALLLLSHRENKAMLEKLKKQKIPVEYLEVEAGMQQSLDSRVEDLLQKNPDLLAMAQRAFKSYLKNLHYMKDKTVFDVDTVDRERLARSFGLVTTPQVKFVERLIDEDIEDEGESAEVYKTYGGPSEILDEEDKDNDEISQINNNNDEDDDNSTTENETTNINNTSISSEHFGEETVNNDDSEEDNSVEATDAFTQDKASLARAFYKNDSVKRATIVAKECPYKERFEELFFKVSELSGPLANPPTDYSKYLAKPKKINDQQQDQEEQQQQQQNSTLEFTMSSIMSVVERNKKGNKLVHKQKIKERRRDLQRKRQDKKGGVRHSKQTDDDGDEAASGSDDDDGDPFTQQIIDELPDVDEIRTRERLQNLQHSPGVKDPKCLKTGVVGGYEEEEEYIGLTGAYKSGDNSGVNIKRNMTKRKRNSLKPDDEELNCKKIRRVDSDEDSTDSDNNEDDSDVEDQKSARKIKKLSLQDQEDLALQLLMGNS